MASTGLVLYLKPRAALLTAPARSTGMSVFISVRMASGVIQSGIPASTNQLNLKAWLPPPRQRMVGPDGICDPRWYRFFQWFTEKMGGPNGPSILDMAASVETAQSQATSASLTATGLEQQAVTNAEALSATIQVVQNNALAGATQIPPVMITPVITGDGGSGGEGF